MTTIHFDLRVGGGQQPFVGGVTFTPTRVRYDADSITLPKPQTIGLHAGKGTMTGVQPTPAGSSPSWAYRVEMIEGRTGKKTGWLVTVPDAPSVDFDELTRPVQVTTPTIDVAALAEAIDGATQSLYVDPETGQVTVTRIDGTTYAAGVAKGIKGDKGDDGAGIPPGGTAGQVPARTEQGGSAWADVAELVGEATPEVSGLLSAADKAKLDASQTSAEIMAITRPSRASVAWGTYMGCPYSVVRIFDATRPGVIGKTLANGFEAERKTGSALVPGFETIRQAQARTGWPVVANADGWRTTGNIGELRGVQIIDGTIYHEFEDPAANVAQQGLDAVGILADGSYRAYSALDGDTAAGMIADGVITSFCFGPRIVIEGTERDLSGSFWTSYQTTKTAHQIIGYTSTGDFAIISLTGISGSTGIAGVNAAALALQEGLHDAWIMDRGGSTQTAVNGNYVMPSSDQNCERPIPAFLLANAIIGTGDIASPWWPLSMQTATITSHESTPSWRLVGDRIECTGGVQMVDGSKIPGAVNYAMRLPFKPARQTVSMVPSAGTYTGKVVTRTDGQINLNGDGSTTNYLKLDQVSVRFLP